MNFYSTVVAKPQGDNNTTESRKRAMREEELNLFLNID
jgi:hypothetical protein